MRSFKYDLRLIPDTPDEFIDTLRFMGGDIHFRSFILNKQFLECIDYVLEPHEFTFSLSWHKFFRKSFCLTQEETYWHLVAVAMTSKNEVPKLFMKWIEPYLLSTEKKEA